MACWTLEMAGGDGDHTIRSRASKILNSIHRCGEVWCYTPLRQVSRVSKGAKHNKKTASVGGASVRATISFPSEMYRTLEDIANQKKVSLAWVVREAVDQYITAKW